MENSLKILILFLLLYGCSADKKLVKYGKEFHENRTYQNLNQVVELMPLNIDSSYVIKIMGEPIDNGFDLRYLLDSIGPNGCYIGVVFQVNQKGIVYKKWIDEICE